MRNPNWLRESTPAFQLIIATSWLAPDSWGEWQDERIRSATESGIDWGEYLSLVDRHRTPAVSWAALKRVPGLCIPDFAIRDLRRRSDACRIHGVFRASVLTEVASGFNDADIPLMFLKGPLLSLELYNDLGVRQSKDLDILVCEQDVPRARACLDKMGWIPEAKYSILKTYQTEFLLRYDYHVGYFNPKRDCFLELHWKCMWDAPGQAARRWERSNPSLWRGYPIRAMHPTDIASFLCNHGGKHLWSRAKWLGDIARIHCMRSVEWVSVLQEARTIGGERPILLALQLLKEAYGLRPPELSKISNKELPLVLLEKAVRELGNSVEVEFQSRLKRAQELFLVIRLRQLLWPRRTWSQTLGEVAYIPVDFESLVLPRRFVWAYAPLRPLLWAWRQARRSRT